MEKSYCAICTPYRAGGLTLKRPGRADSRHSTVRSPSTRTSAYADSSSRSAWPPTGRGCSRIFQYENPKTTKLLTSFLPRFLPEDTPQDRTQVLIVVTTPPVTRSPVQPRSLDFVQPGVGLLPSIHLDGVSVLHRTRPPGCRHERTNISFDLKSQEVKEYRANIAESFYIK